MPTLTVAPRFAWPWSLSARRSEARLSDARRLAWTTVALAASGSTTLAFNVVMARVLSREDFGHVARIYAGGMIVAQLTMASIAPALMRRVAQSSDHAEGLQLARSATRLLFLAVAPVSLLYLALGAAGVTPGDPLSLLLGWALAFVYPLYFGLKSILFALGLVRTYALLEATSDVAFFLLLALLALLAPSAGLLVFPLAYLLFVFVTATLIRRSAQMPLAIAVDRPLLRFGAFALVGTYASVTQAAAVVLITGALVSSSAAAEIAAVIALAAPLGLLPQAAGILSFVGAARGGDDFSAALRHTVRTVSLIVGAGCFTLALLAQSVVDVVLGARYATAVPSLLVVLIGFSASFVVAPIGNALAGQGRVATTASVSAVGFSIAALGALIATPHIGAVGAAVALAAAYGVTSTALFFFGRARFGVTAADVAPAIALTGCGLLLGTADIGLPIRLAVLLSAAAVGLAYRFVRLADLKAFALAQGQLLLGGSLAALGLGFLVAVRPQAALAVAAIILVAWAVRIEPRYLLAGLLVYLPIEEIVLTHLPAGAVVPVRYGPEFLLDALVLLWALPRLRIIRDRSSPLLIPLLIVVCFWTASAIWNAVAPGTAVIGFRSEFRFLPLLVLPLLSRDPGRDARFYARILALVASFEVVLFAVEAVGGRAVRSLFATNYAITVGGVQVTAAKSSAAFGTFGHYNAFGTFLVLAFTVIAAAGSRGLGLSRRSVVALLGSFAAAIVVSGSRESAIALLACVLVIGWIRFRPRLAVVALAACLTAVAMIVLVGSEPTPNATAASRQSSAVAIGRFQALLTPSIFSINPNDPHSNFRLYLLASNVALVREQAPMFGFGTGSVNDPRTLLEGTNPIYRTNAGRRAAAFGYFYDGNWDLVLLETGIAGLAALAILFFALARVGLKLAKAHWIGTGLVSLVAAIVVLGFFQPVLQLRPPAMLLWLSAGLSLALTNTHGRKFGRGNSGEVAS